MNIKAKVVICFIQ